jgi:hypothetical protein
MAAGRGLVVRIPFRRGPLRLWPRGGSPMGKGNHSQKNDKKNKKPKQDKTKAAVKK